jgi:dUTP pyrophosphatase
MKKSYYLTGWQSVSTDIPLHLTRNTNISYDNYEIYDIHNDLTYNADVMLGIIDAIGILDTTSNNITLTIPYINFHTSNNFLDMIKVPHKIINDDTIIITGINYIDFMGKLYSESTEESYNTEKYNSFSNIIQCDQPIINFVKHTMDAITPTKANFSDVGYDISIINIYKILNSKTILYDTGIKLEIPIGYYVEIVPRSSIVKSGYMLSNSIGIIDCSYKGNLFIALTKICDDAVDFEFPFKCCQLIIKKQVFPTFIEIKKEDISESKRNNGGFGSTNV